MCTQRWGKTEKPSNRFAECAHSIFHQSKGRKEHSITLFKIHCWRSPFCPKHMTPDELRLRYPNASPDFVRINSDTSGRTGFSDRDPRKAPQLERTAGNGAMEALPVQTPTGGHFLVRVTSYRRRLLDEDNLAEKFHVDLCRYAGALPSDAAGKAKIQTSQKKVGAKEREFVHLEIFRQSPVLIPYENQAP